MMMMMMMIAHENVKHMLLVEWMEGERISYMLMLNKWVTRNRMERKWKPM